MIHPYFRINDLDILPLVEAGGLNFELNDVDSPDAGRTLDGDMHRGKVCSKAKYIVKCLPLSTAMIRIVLNELTNEYVTVSTNIDPMEGTVTRTMYNSKRPATCWTFDKETGVGKWTDLTFSLIER